MQRFTLVVGFTLMVMMPVTRGGELPRAEPEHVGMSAKTLENLKPELQKLVDDGKIPGALALIARHGKIVYITAVGYRDLATRTPITEDTIFAIASMTKPVTCVAAMILVEQGKLALDDPVEKYLPELKNLRALGDPKQDTDKELATVAVNRPITIRELFTHTSGIGYGFNLLNDTSQGRLQVAYRRGGVTGGSFRTVGDQVKQLGKVPLAHQPGERWTYGFSHDVLGRVIEVVSGQPFDKYLQEHILTPLDMPDTSFFVPRDKRDRVATIYNAGVDGKLTALPKSYGSATFFSGGGGLFSTIRDYTRFAQMLLNKGELDGKRIVKPETIERMTTNQIGSLTAFGLLKYGLGFGLIPDPVLRGNKPGPSRYFWGGMYSTNFAVNPRRNVVTVIMTQVLPTNHGGAELIMNGVVEKAIVK